MDILIAILLGLLGLVVCFAGLRVFFVALPIIGFVTGFYIGAAGVSAIFNEGFLSSVTSVIVGFVVGLVLAILAYVLWYVGALLSAGSTGALLASSIMNGIGVDSGWIVAIVAIAAGIAVFLIAFRIALPIYIVIVNTAFLGAAAVVTGGLMLFNQIDRSELGNGTAWALIEASWFWLFAWAAIMMIGMLAQLQTVASVVLPEERWSQAKPV